MKLIDLLSVTNENVNIVLFDLNNKTLDVYDGKNSIDNIYNDYDIIEINHTRNDIEIVIDFELEEIEEDTRGKYENLCNIVADNRYNDLYLFWQ